MDLEKVDPVASLLKHKLGVPPGGARCCVDGI